MLLPFIAVCIDTWFVSDTQQKCMYDGVSRNMSARRYTLGAYAKLLLAVKAPRKKLDQASTK